MKLEDLSKEELINNNEDSATKSLFGYQKDAINNWIKNDYTGIFEHVTGAGKTFEAIRASYDNWLKFNKPVVVIVPTIPLAKQWEKEFIELSPKGTVPVLEINESHVIDESIDIVKWFLSKNDPHQLLLPCQQDNIEELLFLIDKDFKYHLDRYKYLSK